MFAAIEPKDRPMPLYHVSQMPKHFQKSFVVKGYRPPNSSPVQCILSLFEPTNETLNFWTHFIPSWYFLYVLRDLCSTVDFQHDCYAWPMLAYLCVCTLYPLTSALAHTFSAMSSTVHDVCFFCDYNAISLYCLGAALSYRAYACPSQLRKSMFGELFIPVAVFNNFVCVVVSCWSRLRPPSQFNSILRLVAFGFPCVYDIIPITYRLTFGTEAEMNLSSCAPHMRGICLMFLSGLAYASHFPERFFPGRFDIVGHSHQLFHVCSALGTMEQMHGNLRDMWERRATLEEAWEFTSLVDSIGMVGVVVTTNTVIVLIFSYILCGDAKRTCKTA